MTKMKARPRKDRPQNVNNPKNILKQILNPGESSGSGGGGGGGIRKRFGHKNAAKNKPKTRKEIRKEERKSKKSEKHKYILTRLGKAPEPEGKKKRKRNRKRKRNNQQNKKKGDGDDQGDRSGSGSDGDDDEKPQKKPVTTPKKSKKISEDDKRQSHSLMVMEEENKELQQLKKEMEETRKRRLLEENEDEDKYISRMEKKLKLNKKAKIPASFKVDGLDYLLELCQSSGKKKKKPISNDKEDEEEEDDDGIDSGGDMSPIDEEEDDEDVESDDYEDEDNDDGRESGDEEEDVELESDFENCTEEVTPSDEEDLSDDAEDADDMESDGDDETKTKPSKSKVKLEKKVKKKDEGLWEDIYGRMRRKDGSVVDEKSEAVSTSTETKPSQVEVAASLGKYVPPSLRKNQSQRDKITRSLKGLLNRMSEANMHSISKQVEELYMENSRNEINDCMLSLLYAVLLRNVIVPERTIHEHIMLIAILHANIGTEIGAFFLQKFVEDFRSRYDAAESSAEDKELENLILLISSMYHFKVVDACLMYDILNMMAANFQAKDVELILAALRTVGFRLRKDDPVALKSLIVTIQQKASASKSSVSGAKVKFMLEIVTAIRNNNMSKIPNYDPSVGDHLQKVLKAHIHKGNYVSTMKIRMEDLLNAETKGRWWIVGSAWSNSTSSGGDAKSPEDLQPVSTVEKERKEKMLSKARKLGMNTETRKNIFCILMTSEDYMDAFEKLNRLDLKNTQEREIIHVSIYCCMQEKKFNPYYGLIASKFCSSDRKFMLTLQYNLWDRLKDLESLKQYQRKNLAKLLVHLINDKTLSLSTLKVIDYAEMDKTKLTFLKDVLSGILLQKDETNIQEIFYKSATGENLNLFRESLRLFMGHFMLQENVITSDGENVGCGFDPDTMAVLKDRIKLAENTLSLGKGKVQF